MRSIAILGVGAVCAVAAFALFFVVYDTSEREHRTLCARNASFVVDIADTPELRTKGLSGTPMLKEGAGMLFVFPSPGMYGFWMNDMQYSLDIMWLDSAMRVVYALENIAPETFPEVFTNPVPAQYVLEVPAGTMQRYGIQEGDVVGPCVPRTF